ncbi:MAG: sugar phosphate isomerase/epimerase [Bacteroidetes bacterium]|jgi:sugar phosphate isomerase/epimerase|nr:sugar phosphate isomerase/epimerase [Bacteroidota bacterium]
MKIKYFCPLWGWENHDFKDFCQRVTDAGYDGVEMSFPLDDREREQKVSILQSNGLEFIAQHHETSDKDVDMYKKNFRERLINLAKTSPLFINSQTGKDFFSFEQNKEIIQLADAVSADKGVKILHETHRGKFSFACHIARQFLQALPDLRITLDASHWCNVAESMLEDQKESLEMAISRADYIHARIGFPEGPQIPDPRAPEWHETVEIYINWWQKVIDRAMAEGKSEFIILPEFGPVPYMTIQPFTQMTITNQWDVNAYMKDMLKDRLKS